MLVISRRTDEGFFVETPAGMVRVVVTSRERDKVRLGIECPRAWHILRDELADAEMMNRFEDQKKETDK